MTAPTPKFVTADEVIARYEGEFPVERTDWLNWRIVDVENVLMGLVVSLRKPLDQIEADSVAYGDPGRVDRVKTLIADTVLELFRNPDGATSVSQTMEGDSVTRSFYASRGGRALSSGGGISFTDEELDGVKLRRRRRNIGTIPVAPWTTPCF